MEALTRSIMQRLEKEDSITSDDIPEPCNQEHLHGALLSLASRDKIKFSIEEYTEYELTKEGIDAMKNGSQEYRFYKQVGSEGVDEALVQEDPCGAKHAFKNNWIRKEGNRIYRAAENATDRVVEALSGLSIDQKLEPSSGNSKMLAELKKRSLIRAIKKKIYRIEKGPSFEAEENLLPELTSSIVINYEGQRFKKYNFDAIGNIPLCGSLHPLMKMREEIARIFIEMGFSEMETSQYVESSFWNFDSLFQPQNHPARDAHDTFFLKVPAATARFDEKYLERVQTVHLKGGHGSTGHGGDWSRSEAAKNILRTHTTAVSSRYLKKLSKNFSPSKLFSIDKVFRNESVDSTHLAEFHQVEGLIAGYYLGINDLMGVLKAFFEKLGIPDVRFKPAFNPYTEPSMEVFGFHPGLGKWIELGNSGVFRPEMLVPMGYGPDVSVIAWGLSLERPAMIKYGLNNIRELVGHKVDLDFIRGSPFIQFN